MNKFFPIIIAIVLCFLIGYLSSTFQKDALVNWYPTLNKPSLTPPNYVFPIAWGLLYLMMGISIGLLWGRKHPQTTLCIRLFAIQLSLNFLWSICFFYFKNPTAGIVILMLLLSTVIWYTIKSYPVNVWSSVLFIPYILWLMFAAYLNGYIVLHNP